MSKNETKTKWNFQTELNENHTFAGIHANINGFYMVIGLAYCGEDWQN